MNVKTDVSLRMNYDDLRVLLKDYKYGRYCEDRSYVIDMSRRLLLDETQEYLSKDNSRCIVAFSSSEQIMGVLLFKLSQWDTSHFGFDVVIIDAIIIRDLKYDQNLTIANALLEKFEVWCQTNGARFVSVRISAQSLAEIHSLERSGFRYIESWIYNKYDLSRVGDFGETRCELRLAMPDDCNIMLDYSRGAFVTHRFHADPGIVREKADSLYEKWILSAFGDPKQRVLVLDIDNRPVAFMIYYKKDLRQYFGLQFAMWKMALIDPANRDKGLGTDFFIALLHYHQEEGLDVVDSGLSMRNVKSLNLHIKLGFEVISTLVTLHKWLK